MQDNVNKDNSFFTEWWSQINKPILVSILSLIFIGLFISLTINQNNQYSNTSNIFSVFSFQAIYLIVGLALCFLISFFDPTKIRFITIILFSSFLVLLFLTLIFGNEIKGVSQNAIDLSNDVIVIDQFGTKHSLNISNCSAILIWEFFKSLS